MAHDGVRLFGYFNRGMIELRTLRNNLPALFPRKKIHSAFFEGMSHSFFFCGSFRGRNIFPIRRQGATAIMKPELFGAPLSVAQAAL